MKIIFAGCSHTCGAEIISSNHPGCPERSYGRHLADKFNAEYEVIAGPGWSNRWIYTKLYKRLETIEKNDVNNYRVVVGWTSTGRVPVWDIWANEVYHMCPVNYDPRNSVKEMHKAAYSYALPENETDFFEHSLVVGIQSILKQMNIKYMFHWAIHDFIPNKNCNDLVDKNRFLEYYNNYNNQNSFYKNYLKNHYDQSRRWKLHAPESYHKIYAEKLYYYINDNKLF